MVIEILPKLGSAIVRKVINIETSLAVTESKNFCNCLNSSMNFCEYPSWSSRIFSLMEAVEFGKLVKSGYQIVKLWSYRGKKTQLIEKKKFHEICFEYFQWHYFTKVIVICIPLLNHELTGFGGLIWICLCTISIEVLLQNIFFLFWQYSK